MSSRVLIEKKIILTAFLVITCALPGSKSHAGSEFFPAALLHEGRNSHTATLLNDGRVLVAGGRRAGSNNSTNTAEIYDPVTDSFSPTGSLILARSEHHAVRIPDGRVLVSAGGAGIEIYDPQAGSWTASAPPGDALNFPLATSLPDGRFLMLGNTPQWPPTPAAWIFDPASHDWSPAPAQPEARYLGSAVALADGRVLVAGGSEPGTNNILKSTAIFDPVSFTWSSAAPMNFAGRSPLLLLESQGTVLATSGVSDGGNLFERFNPSDNTWSVLPKMNSNRSAYALLRSEDREYLATGGALTYYNGTSIYSSSLVYDSLNGLTREGAALNTPRCLHQATRLNDGRILITGGWGYHNPEVFGDFNHGIRQAEIYQPAAGHWTTTEPMAAERTEHTAVRLNDGRILAFGGIGYQPAGASHPTGPVASAEILDPVTMRWSPTAPLTQPTSSAMALILPDGRVMSVGKWSSEIYDPASGTWTGLGQNSGAERALVTGDGRVFLTGFSTGNARIFDPATSTWLDSGNLQGPRGSHRTVLLQNGNILAVGEFGTPAGVMWRIYSTSTGSWGNAYPLGEERRNFGMLALASGKVIICGGTGAKKLPLRSTLIFDPAKSSWSQGPEMGHTLYNPTLFERADGGVMGIGLVSRESTIAAELLASETGKWIPVLAPCHKRPGSAVAALPDGSLLACGGTVDGTLSNITEIRTLEPSPLEFRNPIDGMIASGATVGFGKVGLGFHLEYPIIIRNTGNTLLEGLSLDLTGGNPSDFVVSGVVPEELAAGSEAVLSIRFSPQTSGAKTAILRFNCTSGVVLPIHLNLSGRGSTPGVHKIEVLGPSLDPIASGTVVDLGTRFTNTDHQVTFVIRNAGSSEIYDLKVGFDPDFVSPAYTIPNPPAVTELAAGEETSFTVMFNSSSQGTRLCAISISSNDDEEDPFGFSIQAQAVEPRPRIEVEMLTGGADFGSVATGTSSSATFRVKNTGNTELAIQDSTLSVTSAQPSFGITPNLAGMAIPAGEYKDLDVSFSPTLEGHHHATLEIRSNSHVSSTYRLHLSGYAVTLRYEITDGAGLVRSSGLEHDFTGVAKTSGFEIRNPGPIPIGLSGIALSGSHGTSFRIDPVPFPNEVPAFGSVPFTVTFIGKETGIHTATATIGTSHSELDPFFIGLKATVVAKMPEISVEHPFGIPRASGSPVSFGNVKIGKPGKTRTFRIRNTGQANLSVIQIIAANGNKGDFKISASGPRVIGPGTYMDFKVTFKPKKKGIRKSLLRIVSSDGDESRFDLSLSGKGS